MKHDLQVGFAAANITPRKGIWLDGYAGRRGPAPGVHDELFAKCLVLAQHGRRFVLITTDLCGLSAELGEAIRRRIRQTAGITETQIILTSSHTHSGPLTGSNVIESGRCDPRYLGQLVGTISGCVQQAGRNLRKARMGFESGHVRINVNRRGKIPPGSILTRSNLRGVVDVEVGVIKFSDRNGKILGQVINYACHPVVMERDNLLVSADYPGVAQRVVQAVLGGETLFTLGCCGNVNPLVSGGTFADMERLGTILAEEAIRTSRLIEWAASPEIEMREQRIILPRHCPYEEAGLQKIIAWERKKLASYGRRAAYRLERCIAQAWIRWATAALAKKRAGRLDQGLPLKLQALCLGELALVVIPAEVFVEIGLAIKRQARFRSTFVLTCADGAGSYIPTARAFREGGYETEAFIWEKNGLPFRPAAARVLMQGVRRLLRA